MDLFLQCPHVTVQKLLSGKWSIYILHLLSEKTMRFNELLRIMPERLTHTTLSRQLKTLEEQKLIVRKDYNTVPPKVEYSLSEIGNKLRPVLFELEKFGNTYIDYIKK